MFGKQKSPFAFVFPVTLKVLHENFLNGPIVSLGLAKLLVKHRWVSAVLLTLLIHNVVFQDCEETFLNHLAVGRVETHVAEVVVFGHSHAFPVPLLHLALKSAPALSQGI
jgi:hypothetical protein